MPLTGYTHICRNKECAAYRKELWINPSWPLGDIDAVITSSKVVADKELQSYLQSKKNEGRKQALIQVPNNGEVPIVGYRFFLYCVVCHVIWEEDILFSGGVATGPAELAHLVPKRCVRCGDALEISDEVDVEKLYPCPHCDQPMDKRNWYADQSDDLLTKKNGSNP